MSQNGKSPQIPIAPILKSFGCANPPEPGTKWHAIKCVNPEHADDNASAGSNGYGYKCHGCGLKGDAVKLVMEVKKCDRSSAVKLIESISGGSIGEISQMSAGESGGRIPNRTARANARNNRTIRTGIRKRPFAGP